MSRASGFAKLVNAGYTRIKPNLCPHCQYFKHARNNKHEWHECTAKQTLLSNPHSMKGRCEDYLAGEQRLDDAEMAEIQAEYNDWKDISDKAKARGSFVDQLAAAVMDQKVGRDD